jgi:ubiquitin-like 1-activating enzyme E1 B
MDCSSTSDEVAMQVLNIGDQVSTFVKAMARLFSDRKDDIGAMLFNKDDDLIVEFVSAATNIRAYNFSIPLEVKTKR